MLITSIEESLVARVGAAGTAADTNVEAHVQARWYAVYTRANLERRVADELAERGVETFLPQYESVRKWRDRRVRLKMALFPGYVFVNLALQDRLKVLQVPGVAYLVSFAGRPVAVPEEEFTRIRVLLNKGLRAEPHPYLKGGRRVRVRSGPLEGMEGNIIRRKNGSIFVISLTLLQRSIAVEVAGLELEPAACTSGRNETATVHG